VDCDFIELWCCGVLLPAVSTEVEDTYEDVDWGAVFRLFFDELNILLKKPCFSLTWTGAAVAVPGTTSFAFS
jgi:hypothetical protein